MTFDWFRRRYDEEKTEAEQSAETQQAPPDKAQQDAVNESEKAEDYLNWAKLAYENIKKRQQLAAQLNLQLK